MSKVIIHLAPIDVLGNLFIREEVIELAQFALPRYTIAGSFETDKVGEAAAEEAFDLTNNPDRQEEREEKYGRGRSVSSGDVIEVDGEKWLCMSFGWRQL